MDRLRLATFLGIPLVLFATWTPALAQADTLVAQATDLAVPAVPAFTLLGVNPASVVRPGLVKDFNLDLIARNGSLAPDLALETRPVWILGFRRVSRPEYVTMHPILRALSTLSVSLGTVDRDTLQELAWAAKLSVIRPDPLLDTAYVRRVGAALDITEAERRLAMARVDSLIAAQTAADTARIDEWYERQLRAEIASVDNRRQASVRAAVKDFQAEHWNALALDIAVGQVFRYEGARFQDLTFQQRGFGAWIAAGHGFGTRRWLFSALARVINANNGEREQALATNIRFGGATVNGFVEYVFEDGVERTNTVAYGGEYRSGDRRAIEFGIRTVFTDQFEFRRLQPVVKLRWDLGEMNLSNVLAR